MQNTFFPRRIEANPTIYAYEDTAPQYRGLLKVGYTAVDVQKRVAQQYPTLRPGALPYRIVLKEPAMRGDGTSFTDHEVHRVLRQMGVENPEGEWFRCSAKEVRAAIRAVRNPSAMEFNRTESFGMRPEQADAVAKTSSYFRAYRVENKGRTPHFLWNCKMRFGKTFAAYQLAREMGWKRILVLTFKPAVQSAWEDDLRTHIDFEGWQFISRTSELTYETADRNRPIVCFGSFQDYLGKSRAGGIKAHHEWVHAINWDCVILDEYHYGAWRDNAKDLFENEDKRGKHTPRARVWTTSMRAICPSLRVHISTFRERRSEQSIRVSSSRSRYTIGLTPMSSEQKQSGTMPMATTHTPLYPVW